MELVEREEGRHELMVAASEKEAKAEVVDPDEAAADVSLRSEVDFVKAPQTSHLKWEERVRQEGEDPTRFSQLVDPSRGHLRVGSIEESDESDTELIVKTHSGKVLTKGGSNRSHAEDLFANWVYDESEKIGRIKGVTLVLSGQYTPCVKCAETLVRLAAWLKRHGATSLELDYSAVDKLYPASKADGWTNEGNLRRILSAPQVGWTVAPWSPKAEREKLKVKATTKA